MLNINETKFMTQKEAELKIFDDILIPVSLENCDMFMTDFENYVKAYRNKWLCIESRDISFYGCVEMITTLLLMRKKVDYYFTDDNDMKAYEEAIKERLREICK